MRAHFFSQEQLRRKTVFKNLAAGGQKAAHGARMLRQVIKNSIIIGFLVAVGFFAYYMWAYPHSRYLAFPKLFKAIFTWDLRAVEYYDDRVVEVFEDAFVWLKRAAIYGGYTFLGSAFLFQFSGKLGNRRKKIKTKSTVKKAWIKNPFHRGFYIGKASLPKGSETKHILVSGGTGSGKTNAFHHIIPQIRKKGQKGVIVDTTGAFIERYYDPRKDVILDPQHEATKQWTPWADAQDPMDYQALAKSFIPILPQDHDSYWKEAAASVFAALLKKYAKKNTTIEGLTKLLLTATLDKLISAVKETEGAAHISKDSDRSTASIRSIAAANLECLKYLKTTPEPFSINHWIQDPKQNGFLFLGCTPKTRKSFKPLLSAWYSTAIRAIMCLPPSHDRRIWMINDELPSMGQITDLETCLTEGRKYGVCALLAIQSPSQLVDIYGNSVSKTITANCNTKIVFKESEPANAKQLSQLFGEQELQEVQEGISYGSHQMRDGVNQSKVLRNRPLISSTDIQNLKTNQCFLRKDEKTQRVKLKFLQMKKFPSKKPTKF